MQENKVIEFNYAKQKLEIDRPNAYKPKTTVTSTKIPKEKETKVQESNNQKKNNSKNSNKKKGTKYNKERAEHYKEYKLFLKKKQRKNIIAISSTIAIYSALCGIDYFTSKNNLLQQEEMKPVTYEEAYKSFVESNPKIINIDNMLYDYSKAVTLDQINNTNELYSNKYIELTGEVKNLYVDAIDGNYITLDGYKDWYNDTMSVQCNFDNKEEIQQLKYLDKGDDITLRGYCLGGNGMSIKINDCEIK